MLREDADQRVMGLLDRVTQECLEVLGHPLKQGDSFLWFSSGTAALTAALRAAARLASPNKSARVLLPAPVCPQVYLGVLGAGLEPVFVASDPLAGDYGFDLSTLNEFPSDGAVALVWVHQYGCVGQAGVLPVLCRRKGWVLVEDAALTFGVEVDGVMAGTMGDCGILSFGTGKVVDAGYGGAVLVKDWPMGDALTPLLHEEWAAINQSAMTDDGTLSTFDRELKHAYNESYDELRNGSLSAVLHPLLSICARSVRSLDANRLNQSLPPGALALAASRVRERNARAQWWAEHLGKAGGPVIGFIQHSAGTYWRFNILVEPAVRHTILRAGLAAGSPISSWFPPLYWLVPRAMV